MGGTAIPSPLSPPPVPLHSRPMNPLPKVLPFWLSLCLPPLAVLGMVQGGWTIALVPLAAWGLFSALDAVEGRDEDNADLSTPEAGLFWYRLVTLVWVPLQFALLFWAIWSVTH